MKAKRTIFSNAPIIGTTEKDFIGIDSYVEVLEQALLKDDIKIVGLIGEYGSGKSSVLNLLTSQLQRNSGVQYLVKKITLIQLVKKKDMNSIEYLKSFIQGLTDEEPRLKSYVNRKFSSFGELSFALLNKIDFFDYVAVLSFLFILVFSDLTLNSQTSDPIFNFLLISLRTLSFLMKDNLFYTTLLFIIIIASRKQIVFSLWDSQGKRSICEDDAIEALYNVITQLSSKKQNLVIIIEDADRIDEFESLMGFLSIIHRLVQSNHFKNVKFVVSTKDESSFVEFEDIKKQGNKTNQGKEYFLKIFDFTVNIKRINKSDYAYIAKNLLISIKNTKEFQFLGEPDIDKLFYKVAKVLDGKRMDIRLLKERMNLLFQKYVYLNSLESDKIIDIQACAFSIYLESEYKKSFDLFISYDNRVNDIFQKYLTSQVITIKDIELIDSRIEVNFTQDLMSFFSNRIFDQNIRMYFYQYPKNVKILNPFEDILLNMLSRYDDDTNGFDQYMSYVRENRESLDMLHEHLNLLESFKKYPTKLVLANYDLFKHIVSSDFEFIKDKILVDIKNDNSKIEYYFTKLNDFYSPGNVEVKNSILSIIVDSASRISQQNKTVSSRLKIKDLLLASDKVQEAYYNLDFPEISEEEIEFLSHYDINVVIKNIIVERITSDNSLYILNFIKQDNFNEDEKIVSIIETIFKKNLILDELSALKLLIKYRLYEKSFQERINYKDQKDYKRLLQTYIIKVVSSKNKLEANLTKHSLNFDFTKQVFIKLLPNYLANGYIDKYVEIIIKFKTLWDMLNDSSNINTITSFYNTGKYSIEGLTNFRSFLLSNKEEVLANYLPVFSSKFPKLKSNEVIKIHKADILIRYVALENIEENAFDALCLRIKRLEYNDISFNYLIGEIWNRINIQLYRAFAIKLLSIIDFVSLKESNMTKETRELLFDVLYKTKSITARDAKLKLMSELRVLDFREVDQLIGTIPFDNEIEIIIDLINTKELNDEEIAAISGVIFEERLDNNILMRVDADSFVQYHQK